MKYIDINCDLGEGYGLYSFGNDKKIMKYISSVNIACGFHAGDPFIMKKTVKLALENNISVGAHPGYNDIQGFGRRHINLSLEEIRDVLIYQIGALDAFLKTFGSKLHHVKPHGALYNLACENYDVAFAIAKAVYDYDKDLILYGLFNSKMIEASKNIGLRYANEIFADRRYDKNSNLVSRKIENSVIKSTNESIKQCLSIIKNNETVCISGEKIILHGDTLCIHSDGEHALDFAKNIKEQFDKNEIIVKPIV
jgi:UPF0271 protein